jgi:hypothetical protein
MVRDGAFGRGRRWGKRDEREEDGRGRGRGVRVELSSKEGRRE